MKTILLCLSMLFSSSLLAQWERINGSHFNGCEATDENTCYLPGIWKTQDGGTNWGYYSPFDVDLYGPFAFASEKVGYVNGYVKGRYYIFKTIDGASTWKALSTPFIFQVSSVSAVNEEIVFFSIRANEFAKTIDGGKSFTEFQTPFNATRGLYFFDGNKGLIATTSFDITISQKYALEQILYTEDGGNTWQVVHEDTTTIDPGVEPKLNESKRIMKINFIDKSVGYAACGSSTILKTIDGGLHWSLLSILPATENLLCNDVVFEDNGKVGYVAANTIEKVGPEFHTYIYRTMDGGITWNVDKHMGSGRGYATFSKIYNHILYASGYNGVFRREDPSGLQKESMENNITIFPNPVHTGGTISIKINSKSGTSISGLCHLTLFDVSGRIIKQEEWHTEQLSSFKLENIYPGVYQLLITDPSTGNSSIQKIVIID